MRCLNMVVNGEVTRNVTAAGVRLGIVMVSGDYEEIEWVTVRNCWVTSVSGVALYKIRPTLCPRHGIKCFGQSNFFAVRVLDEGFIASELQNSEIWAMNK